VLKKQAGNYMKDKLKISNLTKDNLKERSVVVSYPVGDFLIRIKNASMAHGREVKAAAINKIIAIAQVLKKEGFLEGFSLKGGVLIAKLAYKNKAPVLMNIKLISKPGRRIYVGVRDIEKKKDPSISILSTAKGIMATKEAIKQGVGGELIAEIL